MDEIQRVLIKEGRKDLAQAYYERVGLYIPNVIFPTGAVVKDGLLYLYYGVADTAIALATTPLDALVDHLLEGNRHA